MIYCKPKGLCSWNFYLDGEGHQASIEFNWIGEQGAIAADRIHFDVRKQGVLSGPWTLECDGQAVASAQKSSVFTRTFEIQSPMGFLVLRAESAFGRTFRVECAGEIVATIQPDHPFTRRSTITTLAAKWDFPSICFAFWLAVLMWRRAAQNNS